MAAGSGELAGAARGGAGGAVRFTSGRETAIYMGAAASSCTPADARRAERPKPRPARVTVEEQTTDRWAKGGRGRRRTWRLHAGVRTPRVASVCATPGEGAALGWRTARKPRRARRRRSAGAAHDIVPRRGAERPIHFTVPWFRRVYLQNFELKCTMWSIGKL
jgi:hypothetical protein